MLLSLEPVPKIDLLSGGQGSEGSKTLMGGKEPQDRPRRRNGKRGAVTRSILVACLESGTKAAAHKFKRQR